LILLQKILLLVCIVLNAREEFDGKGKEVLGVSDHSIMSGVEKNDGFLIYFSLPTGMSFLARLKVADSVLILPFPL
jgi:hypothetical protein